MQDSNSSAPEQGAFTFSILPNASGSTVKQVTATLETLAKNIQKTRASEKGKLPWVKFATFGDRRTPKGSLRSDHNITAVTGVEGDFDNNQVAHRTTAEAIQAARELGLECVVHSSPSDGTRGDHWRILLPLRTPITGDESHMRAERRALLKRVEALLGVQFSGESYTLSQSYYYGQVEGNPTFLVAHIPGRRIDEFDVVVDLDEPEALSPEELLQGDAQGYHDAVRAKVMQWAHEAGITADELRRRTEKLLEDAPRRDAVTRILTTGELDRMIDGALGKVRAEYPHLVEPRLAADQEFTRLEYPRLSVRYAWQDIFEKDWSPRYLVDGLVPASSFSLLAAALSSGKTTLLLTLAIARATGRDLLEMGLRMDQGATLLLPYEDGERALLGRFQAILKSYFARIEAAEGAPAAREFAEQALRYVRWVHGSGKRGYTLTVPGPGVNEVIPNRELLERLLKEAHPDGTLFAVDPLRMAIRGVSQNDDRGMDTAIEALNFLADQAPGRSGVLIASHVTKSSAKGGDQSRVDKAYATAGSALLSQHARSNLHLQRIEAARVGKVVAPGQVSDAERLSESVSVLSHARLSTGPTQRPFPFVLRSGLLVPLQPFQEADRGLTEKEELAIIVEAIASKERLTLSLLEGNEVLVAALGGQTLTRKAWKRAISSGYIEEDGQGPARRADVTDKGRAFLATADEFEALTP